MKEKIFILVLAIVFAGCEKSSQSKLVTFEYTATKGSFNLNLFLIREDKIIVLREMADTKAITFLETFEVKSGDKVHGRAKAIYPYQVITGSILFENTLLDKSSVSYNNSGFFNVSATIP